MKVLLAVTVVLVLGGLGLLVGGRVAAGVLLLLTAFPLSVLSGVHVNRGMRAHHRSFRRSPQADDPAVAESLRRSGALVLVLATVLLAAAAVLLLLCAAVAADPLDDPGDNGAAVAILLSLAVVPGLLGGALVVRGRSLLRVAGALALVTLVLVGLAAAVVVSWSPADGATAAIGVGTGLLCVTVLLALVDLRRTVARARQRTDPGRTEHRA